jgi:hypothetical protein
MIHQARLLPEIKYLILDPFMGGEHSHAVAPVHFVRPANATHLLI